MVFLSLSGLKELQGFIRELFLFGVDRYHFATFENIVEAIYKHAIPIPKDQCSKKTQLGVSFAGGYVAGVFCTIVSHPADNLVYFLNYAKGATVGDAVNKLGIMGLCTRGLPLRIVMIGTLTGAQWGIYDASKVFVGLPTTGVEVLLLHTSDWWRNFFLFCQKK